MCRSSHHILFCVPVAHCSIGVISRGLTGTISRRCATLRRLNKAWFGNPQPGLQAGVGETCAMLGDHAQRGHDAGLLKKPGYRHPILNRDPVAAARLGHQEPGPTLERRDFVAPRAVHWFERQDISAAV